MNKEILKTYSKISDDQLSVIENGLLTNGDVINLLHLSKGRKHGIEIGTFNGASAAILSLNLESLITLDIYDADGIIDEANRKEYSELMKKYPYSFERNVKKFSVLFPNIQFIRGSIDSIEIENDYFDLAFIDGDHSKEGFRIDFEILINKIVKGGVIIMHDVSPEYGFYEYYINNIQGRFKEISLYQDSSIKAIIK